LTAYSGCFRHLPSTSCIRGKSSFLLTHCGWILRAKHFHTYRTDTQCYELSF
jgi:hypothetical protein